MARKRRKKKRFRMQPRFLLVLLILAAVAAGTIFIIKKVKERGEENIQLEATPVPTATAAPTSTPKPSLPPNVAVVRAESANPSKLGFSTEIMANRKTVDRYSRSESISFGRDVEYSTIPGVLTFGGNNYRNSFTYGTQIVSERRMKEQWSTPIGAIGDWSGTGWTGQPMIVHWPDETLRWMNVKDEFKTKEGGLTEVIYPAMDGVIHFLDLDTGNKTRDPISTGIVQKGTACIDPRGYPLLYVGQGIPAKNDEGNNAAFIRVYSLLDGSEVTRFGGYDYFSKRTTWQAYDGSPVIAGDTIVYGGENGIFYTGKLNASFDAETGALAIQPDQLVKLRYSGTGYSKNDQDGTRWYGIESSVAVFRNFAYFTDNGGRLMCVDLNTMQLKYVVDVTDETDSTVVIEEAYDDNTVYLYTGSRVRSADSTLGGTHGYSYQRKINGLTGAVVWEKQQACSIGDTANSGGLVSTPHVGRQTSNISNLVIYSFSLAVLTGKNITPQTVAAAEATPGVASELGGDADAEAPADTPESAQSGSGGYQLGGRIIAYDKTTGELVWAVEQEDDYWASPVVIYDENGRAYLIQCDRAGVVTMYDAADGTQLTTVNLGSRIDSTPAVYNNMLVVGTRGKGGAGKAAKICCVKIS